MTKQFLLSLFLWLCLTAAVSGQSKAQRFPEFIYLDESKSDQAERSNIFQKHYDMKATDELRLLSSTQDHLGFTHDKFQQFYKGVKVEAATSTLHSKDGKATLITGNYHDITDLEVVPQIALEEAFRAAEAHVGAKHYKWEEPLSEHNDYEKPTGELVVLLDFESKNPPRLAYKFDIYATEPLYRAHVFVDAHSGQYLHENLILLHANVPATGVSLYDGTVAFTAENVGPYRLRQTSSGGGVQTFNLNNGTNYGAATDFTSATTHFTGDDTGVEAHWASEQTYDYFLSEHGRNSYNNAGAVLKSYVHYSVNYVNAFWDGSRMTYGDGNGGSITPLVTLDICGHEIAHAVTQFTAGLVYSYEPGALNESFSDIFGEMVEAHGKGGNNWLLGDEIGITIRDMAVPNAQGQPDTYLGDFWYYGAGDNGGVHYNSGVQNKWFYLVSVGENGVNDNDDDYCVTGIGINAAASIAYRNLSVYLSSGSNYAAARTGAIQAARDLYGIGSNEEVTVTNAWHAVGVGAPYPATISCPASVSVNATSGQCQAIYNYSTPVGKGNCPSTVRIAGLASGSNFPVGSTVNTFRVTDVDGNTSTCSFTVTVVDNQLPSITCPANQSLSTAPGQCFANASYSTPGASDNCGILSITQTSGLPSGSNFPVGVTTNIWRATDVNANTRTCSFTITVTDLQNPTITCPANISVTTASNQCGANVGYSTPTASDNCGVASVTLIGGLASGAFYPVGVTTNIWRATDLGGRTATCSFTVTVNDGTPPTITCPANIVAPNDPGKCGAVRNYSNPTAVDNCALQSVTLVSGLSSGSFFPVGTTVNVWRANDMSNNTATCSFTVTIVETEAPTIVCPPDRSLLTDPGECFSSYSPQGGVQLSDNCGIASLINNAPIPLPVGEIAVVYTATDFSGNTATCVTVLTVRDLEPPQISCPGNIATLTDEGDCAAVVDFSASASDNCGIASAGYSHDPLSTFEIGYTDVYYNATDVWGNSASCHFQIIVNTRKEICNGEDDDCDGLTDESEDWAKVVKQIASDGDSQDKYGASVDIHGDWAIVGSEQKDPGGAGIGAAYILSKDQNGLDDWGEVAKLLPASVAPGDLFGASVAIGNGVAAVGAPLDNSQASDAGAVYIFYQNGNLWNLLKTLHAADADAGDQFGASLSLDGDRLLVGANRDDESGNNAGAAYIFSRNQGGADNWGQVKKLQAATAAPDDNMGVSVALDGDHAVVGANGVDGLFQNSGAAYVFGRNEGGADNWGQLARMRAAQSGQNDNFGASVAVSGSWAIVGADGNDAKGQDAGLAFAFAQNHNGIQNSWGQHNVLYDYFGSAGDRYGSGVAIDGEYAVVSARGDNPFGAGSGRGFVYLRQDDGWVLVGQLTDGGGQAGDNLGSNAAMDGRRVIMGAPMDDHGSSLDEGSAQIFEGLCAQTNLQQPIDERLVASGSGSEVRCFPVPFSDLLNVEVRGIVAADVNVLVVNTLGQEVAVLHRGAMEGDMLFQWQPNNLKSGVYFLRVLASEKVLIKQIVLSR